MGQASFGATTANQQWAIDFAHRRMVNAGTLRVVSILDTFTVSVWRSKSILVFPAEE
ncbi:MAG TPA: hypothetical protein VHU83_20560 [Bryobacteraceae bacterium]|nr:hypothetical protein [Bryobacteraceae bacterium]